MKFFTTLLLSILCLHISAQTTSTQQSFRINLFRQISGSMILLDGVLAEFRNGYSVDVDIYDAIKFTNIKETLGLQRNGQILAIERRPELVATDTLFLKLSKTTAVTYHFEFEPSGIDASIIAFFEDNYKHTSTPISVMQKVGIDIDITTEPASKVTDRFMIVFKKTTPLPVTFKDIKVYQQSKDIALEWTVENEINVKQYEVAKSVDGVNFKKVNTTTPNQNSSGTIQYKWIDINPAAGNNYYRIRSVDKDDKVEYAKVVFVRIDNEESAITRVYPNPVTNNVIGVEFKNMLAGNYKIRLLNTVGQVIFIKTIYHSTGASFEQLTPGYKLHAGIYDLEILAPGKAINTVKVVVK